MEAYRLVRARLEGIRLDIVSRPPTDLKRKIGELKDAQLLISSPGIDIRALMDQADIFVLPTRADTYALAAVEAMAHGCAVILSDLEPLPEVAPDGETGFVVPVGDAPALAARLEELVSNRELLRAFQQNARCRYTRLHAPEVVAARLKGVFEQVLRRRSSLGVQTDRVVASVGEAENRNSPT